MSIFVGETLTSLLSIGVILWSWEYDHVELLNEYSDKKITEEEFLRQTWLKEMMDPCRGCRVRP